MMTPIPGLPATCAAPKHTPITAPNTTCSIRPSGTWRRRLLGLAGGTALAALGACASTASTTPITRLVVLGDSNVDDGNLLRLSGNQVPAAPNWRGRNSNGPNVADYLARELAVPMRNVAVSGATSGAGNIVPRVAPQFASLENTGVSWQIDQLQAQDGRLRETDLVLIWAGSNDLFGVARSDRALVAQRIAQVLRNTEAALDRLHAMGARRFVLATRTPREAIGTDNDLNGIDLNTALSQALPALNARQPGLRVQLFDAYASIAAMMREPDRYGFTEVKTLCAQVPACANEQHENGTPLADRHINWDAAHKTTRVHKLMAEQLARLVRS